MLLCVLVPTVGMLLFWNYLSGYNWGELPIAAGDTLKCFTQLPNRPLSAESAASCDNLMQAAIKSMLLYPTAIFIAGKP